MQEPIAQESIERKICVMRGQRVMLDKDLAELYGIPTKRLNEHVRRNIKRFPDDFMFRLSYKETQCVMSHSATSHQGGMRSLPYAFTEQGVAMLSTILKSEWAMHANIAIMRAVCTA
jgi:hypothetical protein